MLQQRKTKVGAAIVERRLDGEVYAPRDRALLIFAGDRLSPALKIAPISVAVL
jgi:hypothetical protein